MLDKKPQTKWYLKTSTLIISFLVIGPFALPFLWFNPRYSPKVKIIITIIVIILSYYLGIMLSDSLKSITSYYKTLFEVINPRQ